MTTHATALIPTGRTYHTFTATGTAVVDVDSPDYQRRALTDAMVACSTDRRSEAAEGPAREPGTTLST